MELLLGVGLWLLVTLVLCGLFLFLLGEKYFPNVMGFESRTKIIRSGMLAVVVSGAAFFFLPFTVLHFKTMEIKVNLTQLLGEQIGGAVDSKVGDAVNTTVNKVANSALQSVANMAQQLFLTFATVATLLVAICVVVIVIQTREEMSKKKAVYTRRHVFEYKKEIFEKVNKDFIGR